MSTDRAEIQTLFDRRVEACRDKDIDRLMSIFADDVTYFDVVPPLRFTGAGALRENFLRWFAEYDGPIELGTLEPRIVVSGDVAFGHMLHEDSGNRNRPDGAGFWVRSTSCIERRAGGWRITHEHISLPIDFRDGKVLIDLEP